MNDLGGMTIVITGAGGGIGLAAARAIVDAGANVVAMDLPGTGLASAAEIADEVLTIEGDVTSADAWQATLDAAIARFGSVNGLINNAGIEGAIAPMLEYPDEMFDRVMQVNVKGVWLGTKTLVPAIAESGGGSIVNVSSVAGLMGAPTLSAYSASKHAVIGLTKTAAAEFAAMGIRVNAVCPSPIQTRMMRALEDSMKTDELTAEAIQAAMASNIPLGRYGEPYEVAALMRFLLSDDASFLSGAIIPIDGAMTA